MYLYTSPALKHFKKEVGQLNHLLITIYVGLDGIIPYNLTPNPSLHTSWNPECKKASVDRSAVFARKATVAWLVDCVDMYFHLINQAPMSFIPEHIKNAYDEKDTSRSIYKRVALLNTELGISTVESAFVDLLISWRNQLVHYSADNAISQNNRQLLLDCAQAISVDFCGLDIIKMLEHFDSSDAPTFKEVTSLVRASINYIYRLDRALIHSLDWSGYADRVLMRYLREKGSLHTNQANARLNNLFSKDEASKKRMIQQLLMQNGFSLDKKKMTSKKAITDTDETIKLYDKKSSDVEKFCEHIAQLDYRTADLHLQVGSFLDHIQ